MTNPDTFFIPEDLRESIFAMAASGESAEVMAQRMADAKLEKIVAIKLLRQAMHSTLYEAKERIHFSEAYSYRRVADDAFHDTVFKALEDEGLIKLEPESIPSAA